MTKKQQLALDRALAREFTILRDVCAWLFEHRNDDQFNRGLDLCLRDFDYPEYGGMPKRLANRLSSDMVDRIQEHQGDLRNVRSPATIVGWFVDFT